MTARVFWDGFFGALLMGGAYYSDPAVMVAALACWGVVLVRRWGISR